MRVNYQYLRRIARRSFEKRFGGYLSEAKLNTAYPFQAKRESPHKFFIYTHQRSGSTLLVNLLDSHPLIDCEGELILDPMFSPMSHLAKRQRTSLAEVFGFKLQPHHFTYQNINNPDSFLKELAQSSYKPIILKRRNLFRTALSLLYAINSGKFQRDNQFGAVKSGKVFIDPDDLLENIQWTEQNIELLDFYADHHPHLELFYEDDLMDQVNHQATVNKICDYLGIQLENVKANLVRIMPGDFSSYIENAEEIQALIVATKYARFLEEK